jgi:hypothetical protein
MVHRTPQGPSARDTGVGVGLLLASAFAPGTFARSLSTRSPVDQGMVTGLSTGLHYLLTVATQDSLQALAAELAGTRSSNGNGNGSVARQRAYTIGADLAVIPLGLAVGRVLTSTPGEAMVRGALRQAGWRLAVTGLGGTLLIGAREAMEALDTRLGGRGRIASLPVAIPVGLGLAFVVERQRVAGKPSDGTPSSDEERPPALKSLAIAAGVVGALALGAYAEDMAAVTAGRRLASALPGGAHLWKLTGHAASLGLLAGVGYQLFGRAMRKIEAGATEDHPVFESDEGSRFTSPTVSGGPESLVPWSALGREGRRHALTFVRPEPLIDRPPGIPDLSIETVMGEPAKATPVQIYVSLDSAPTAGERVDLALAEMERTNAFDRSLIMLISPTGTGYVNYVAVAAAQYLTRGDVATVTMQYSKRPSPLSLGKVKEAREQNRLLWLRILDRLHERTGPRPRVVVFGESLGAHTSQDAFLHWGTVGPQALGIDRALWIGTPYLSGWMHEVTGPDRLGVDHDAVAVVNDFAQLQELGDERRARLRYVLVSHDNDGVTKFGPDLLSTAPRWLGPDRPQPEQVSGASPRGIPPDMRWRPITTFFQSLIDMKNAQVPGAYRAWAHDYRPDLLPFISEVFDLPASPQQLADIEKALQERETVRADLFAAKPTAEPARG